MTKKQILFLIRVIRRELDRNDDAEDLDQSLYSDELRKMDLKLNEQLKKVGKHGKKDRG